MLLCYSPFRNTKESLTANFMKSHEDVDCGAHVKLRCGSQHLPHAVPNPYSASELRGVLVYELI